MTFVAGKAAKRALNSLTTDPYLLAILLLSAILRIYDLPRKSIWLDEGYSLVLSQQSLTDIYFQNQDSPPLYYVFLHWWLPLFGTSEFSLRLPSALFGIASVFAIYKVARQLFNVEVARLSSLLMAVSLFHIEYSQEARTYTLTVLLTLISMYCFLDLLQRRRHSTAIAYFCFTSLLIYSHVYAIFIIVSQNLYFAAHYFLSGQPKKNSLRVWILLQMALIAVFAPWASILAKNIVKAHKGFWIPEPRPSAMYSSFITYASESKYLLLLFLLLSVFALIGLKRDRGVFHFGSIFKSLDSCEWKLTLLKTDKTSFLLVWLLISIIVPFAISVLFAPIYVTRYTMFGSVAFLILVASGLSNLRTAYVKPILVVVIMAVSLIQIREYYSTSIKEQWRDVARDIDMDARAGDLLLFNATGGLMPFNYYSRNDTLVKKGISTVDESNIDALWQSVEHADRVWLIVSHPSKNHAFISSKLFDSLALSFRKEYYDIDIYLFSRALAP